MIPFDPIFTTDAGALVIEHRTPILRTFGLIARVEMYVWNGYFWEEIPLPWYRRWAVAW